MGMSRSENMRRIRSKNTSPELKVSEVLCKAVPVVSCVE